MKFIELKKHLAADGVKSCYIISGDDSFVIKSAVNIFLTLTGDFRELNYSCFSKDASLSEVLAALYSPPMLADYRVIRVSDFTGDLKPIKAYLENPNPTSVLIFTGALTANFNTIVPKCEMVDCNRLDAAYLSGWAMKKAAAEKRILASDAAGLLVEYCGRDMNRITGELNKLIDYADEEISSDAVKALVAPELEFKVYELSEAIAEKNAGKAVKLTEALLDDNNSPVSLLGMLFNHFRRLLYVSINSSSDTLASDLKVKEFAVKKAVKQAAGFSPRRLKVIFDRLNMLDAAVKSGAITDKNALLTFVCETVSVG